MRTVLVATLGNSPQVVTETLWALMNPKLTETKRPPEAACVPFRTHMIATGHIAGREGEIRDRITALYRQYGHEPPKDGDIVFDVVLDDSGAPLADIRTARDNGFFSRHIAKTVRDYARDENLRIHLSLAGGRKTMSSYALSAAMFYGRPHDEVSHVLVNPSALETHPDFWWPGQPVGEVVRRGRDGKPAMPVSTAVGEAGVDLVSVPFVPLSPFLPEGSREKATDPGSMARWIRSWQSYKRAGRLVLDFEDRTLSLGEERAELSPKEFTLYALLALARKGDWPGAGPEGIGGDHRGWIAREDYRENTGRVVDTVATVWKAVNSPDDDEDKDTFVTDLLTPMRKRASVDPLASGFSKLSAALESKIPNPYLIGEALFARESRKRRENRMGLVLPPERIEIRNVPPEVRRVLAG